MKNFFLAGITHIIVVAFHVNFKFLIYSPCVVKPILQVKNRNRNELHGTLVLLYIL